jgi:hypothetical protein
MEDFTEKVLQKRAPDGGFCWQDATEEGIIVLPGDFD